MTKKFSSAAFDVLAVGGKDLRKLPLSMRKINLEQLLAPAS
jgi:ATP-dependent DNA ligase